MKFKINILLSMFFLCSLAFSANQYTNPVIRPSDYGKTSAADPFAFKDDNGYYYCYVTGKGFLGYASKDLVRWVKFANNPFPSANYKWAVNNYWAPEVVKRGSTYYMHYTGKDSDGFMKIGLAKSTSPLGPFADVNNKAFYSRPNKSIIDSHIFFDEDGKAYMYFAMDMSTNYVPGSTTKKRSEIWVIEIKPDLTDTIGPAKMLFYPSQSWENPQYNDAWNEAPTMVKHNDIYYLMYSANCYCGNYSVGFAIARSPLGPFTKYASNPILRGVSGFVSGTGHNSVVMSPDNTEMICVYHSHIDIVAQGGNRQINIDRMGFNSSGVMYINGPSYTPQDYPSANATGIEDLLQEKSKLEINYDNTAKAIYLDTPINTTSISIFDTFGKLVYSKSIKENLTNLNIPVDKLSSGLYIVRLENKYLPTLTGKFIR